MGVLSKTGILRNLKSGHIVIEPFEERNLANSSYDVRLGEYFYRQRVLDHTQTLNPFWQKSIESFYSEPMRE